MSNITLREITTSTSKAWFLFHESSVLLRIIFISLLDNNCMKGINSIKYKTEFLCGLLKKNGYFQRSFILAFLKMVFWFWRMEKGVLQMKAKNNVLALGPKWPLSMSHHISSIANKTKFRNHSYLDT